MVFQDKHLLSRLLLLLNPNYSATSSTRNRRPSRRKKPKINVIEGTHSGNAEDFDQDLNSPEQENNIHPLS